MFENHFLSTWFFHTFYSGGGGRISSTFDHSAHPVQACDCEAAALSTCAAMLPERNLHSTINCVFTTKVHFIRAQASISNPKCQSQRSMRGGGKKKLSKINNGIRFHPLWMAIVCAKCHSNPFGVKVISRRSEEWTRDGTTENEFPLSL